jgi:hypothetical protein
MLGKHSTMELYHIPLFHILFILSSNDQYLGWFHILTFGNNTALTMGQQYLFNIWISSGYIAGYIAGAYGTSIFNFLKKLQAST